MATLQAYKVRYQIAPIVLIAGIAQNIPGGMMSILGLSNPNLLPLGLQGQANLLSALNIANANVAGTAGNATNFTNFDDAFGAFTVMPGGTLCANTVPKYPLADMTLAANAIVRDPITVSLIWDTPMRGINAWDVKLATMQALKATLDLHNNMGGRYGVMTPAFYYDNLILTSLTDNSRGGSPLPQNAWRFDFERPMVIATTDITGLTGAQSILVGKLTAGLPTTGNLSGNVPPTITANAQPQLSPGPSSTNPTPVSPSLLGLPPVALA
jgi:hypothetical protein